MSTPDRVDVRIALRDNSRDLLSYFERRVSTHEDAADLLGETMLVVWRRSGAMPRDDAVRQRMWLFKVASNVLANHLRSQRRRIALTARLRQHVSTEDQARDPSQAIAVRDAVARLSPKHRELVTLVHWDGFTIGEAAEVLALNPSTARSRYGEARALLRNALTHDSARASC
jgi:RNA polymerase sigma factor (sigma-70 family)